MNFRSGYLPPSSSQKPGPAFNGETGSVLGGLTGDLGGPRGAGRTQDSCCKSLYTLGTPTTTAPLEVSFVVVFTVIRNLPEPPLTLELIRVTR